MVYRVVAVVSALVGSAGAMAHATGVQKALLLSFWGVTATAVALLRSEQRWPKESR
jgi:hypothetical protein